MSNFDPCVRTLLDERAKCRDSIQKLMRIIIAQGTTISTQLAGLKEKEEAIDNFEERMHNLRMRESGRDYLLHTYLDQLPEVRLSQPDIVLIHSHYQAQSKDAALCVTPRTSRRGGAVTRERARGSPSHPCGGAKLCYHPSLSMVAKGFGLAKNGGPGVGCGASTMILLSWREARNRYYRVK